MAQIETGAALMAPLYLDALVNGLPWAFAPNEVPGALLSAVVRCAGADAWAAVEIEDLDDLRLLAALLERPDLTADEGGGVSVIDDARSALADWARSRTPLQTAFALQRAGLAAAPVQSTEDLWRDPQLRERGAFVEVDHPDLGSVEYPQSPDRMSVTPGQIRGRARRLGEDTVTVLEEWLAMEEADIELLRIAGAIFQAEQPTEG